MQLTPGSRSALLGIVVVLAPDPAGALQLLPGDRIPRKLTAPIELDADFSFVRGVRSLADGRVVVTDVQENKVYLVDMGRGTRTELARTGSGPREYQRVGLPYAGRNGGVLVADVMQRRFLPVGRAGELSDIVAFPVVGKEVGFTREGPDMYTPDTLGAVFGSMYRTVNRSPTAKTGDTLALIRVSHAGDRSDTLALLRQPQTNCLQPRPGMTTCRMVDYSPRDLWTVAPDGWVAVIRAVPYRVEWFPPTGSRIAGPVIAIPSIEVTRAEKDSIFKDAAAPRPRLSGPLPEKAANAPPMPPPPDPVILTTKPATTPLQPLPTDHLGRVWVERHRRAESGVGRVYDVIDRRGVLVDRVELPLGSKLLAVDGQYVYAVRTDADDLQRLQRYRY